MSAPAPTPQDCRNYGAGGGGGALIILKEKKRIRPILISYNLEGLS
jgi:hypothetical protein